MADKEAKSDVREVMDIIELSKYLGIGKSKIYSLIRQKKIPASRIGRQYRFSKSVIDQWLKERLITLKEDEQIPLFNNKTEA
ncbi:MAG: helix-turn-helix domain-containing protein [bacterium]